MRQHAWHAMTQHLLSKGETDTLVYIIDEAVDDLRSHGGLQAMSWASQVWSALADWISGPLGRTLPRDLLTAREQLGLALLDAGRALQVSRDDGEQVAEIQQPPDIHRMAVWAADDWAAFTASLCRLQREAQRDPEYLGDLISILADLPGASSCSPIPMRVYIADMARGLADQIASQVNGLADECRWRASHPGEPKDGEPWTPDPDDLDADDVGDDDLPPQFNGDDDDVEDWDDSEE